METKFWKKELSNIGKATIGNDCIIHSPVWFGDKVVIGNGCKIQAFVYIPDGVKIEDNVFIGPHVCFSNDKHPPSGKENWGVTLVKKGAVIGANATILPGIEIGENAIIGAGSVVTKSIPAGETWVGTPALKVDSHSTITNDEKTAKYDICPECKGDAFIDGHCLFCGYPDKA